MKRFLLTTAALAGVVMTQNAWAASPATANISATATVSTVCTVDAATLNFAEVALSAATPGQAIINVTCTGGGNYTVGLGNGLHAVAAQRNLQSGTNVLAYGLFQDETLLIPWTDSGAGLKSDTGTASAQAQTVFASIPTGQTLVSGNGVPYTDTVLITVAY